ncbi:DUF3427 domain-containing protein [Carnobacterium antarcticum]|uniref:DUF3427 domain-containing protein n=1 Tax=Carnobacterium antarcticum TaxID=2126436 RepID=A0ABW4NNF2_9LACT|nr:DEAD/DEAH box helicase [Carnobacterium sp. CP1]ALV22811.1 DNA/RNA helicase of DEAD/DEAH box [Carnobacterium sp. CP1]
MTDILERSLKKAFMDQKIEGSLYDPQVIINDTKTKQYMLNVLQNELDTCEEFFFSVAFLTQAGLAALKTQLADLHIQGIKGKILTSIYLAFNQPAVFEDLLKIPNIEVRISKKEGFHSKGYLFKQKGYRSFIIGSSNLTMSALKINYEWNVRLTSYEHGQMFQDLQLHMEQEWQEAQLLTQEWISNYQKTYQPMTYTKKIKNIQEQSLTDEGIPYILPNKMQKSALNNLKELRETGAEKGLVISATGTGKTYLSAFDVLQAQPKRVLFVVHREQILNKAKSDYQKILGGKNEDYGILSGTKKEIQANYLFATIQTISKEPIMQQFAKDHFDYILIDEVHKAGAQSYHRILDYFHPKFLLGMTATPERTDGFNIFELFDYNIAYEIRLQEALEEEMLSPFHYFGVTDYEKNGELISEATDLKYLVEEERVTYLLEKLDYYGCSGNIPKGLVFCSRKQEAEALSLLFIKKGHPSSYLSGDHSLEEREKQIERLEKGEIEYIFTVDIFNEGIDIPKINQVVMLRNTESSIIFIQQLGRGLRKDSSKEYVTVIDFIGNYKNNYMIPMALSGDTSRDKNNLRKDTFDTNFISGVSSVNFEKIAKQQIFSSINRVAMDSMSELKKSFELLSNRLGRVPYLKDFQEQQTLEPVLIANKKASYYDFLVSIKQNEGVISETENRFLTIASRELLPGMRKQELILLQKMMSEPKKSLSLEEILRLFEQQTIPTDNETLNSVLNTLNLTFYTGAIASTYKGQSFIERIGNQVSLSPLFKEALNNDYFINLMEDILLTGQLKSVNYSSKEPLTRYQKYKRKDVLRLLNWDQQMVDQNVGGYTASKGEFVIFVTLKKGDNFSGAQMAYEDELLDYSTMKWFTKAPRTMKSPEVQKLMHPEEWTIRVFAKKSDNEGTEFYYLGEVIPVKDSIIELEKPIQDGGKKKVVEMFLKFLTPIDVSLYQYLEAGQE